MCSFLLLGAWLLGTSAMAQGAAPEQGLEQPPTCEDTPAPAPYRRLDLSFGSSLLFVEQAFVQGGVDQVVEQRVVPVPALLLLGEWIWTERWSTGLMLNVPTGTVRRIDPQGNISEGHSAAAVALGPAYAPLNVPILYDATLRPQLALMGGRTINSQEQNQFFPLAVFRLSVLSPNGSSMYSGLAYAFQEETLALMYGFGHRF